MTIISEVARAERWLYTILSQDGTVSGIVAGRIFAFAAPQTISTWPIVVYTMLSGGEDVRGTGATRIMAAPLFLVKAITQGASLAALQTLVDRIDTLLHGQKGGTADATIQYCVRERPFRLATVEEPGNTLYQHLGGEYRIGVSPLVNP